jgi:hypothetical protein
MLTLKHLSSRGAKQAAALLAAGLALSACASTMVQVPPRMDLGAYDRIGIVTFTADPARASLAELATQQFTEKVLDSQHGFELLELGPADSAVARLLAAGDAPAAAQAVGREHNVPAVFFGQLGVGSAKPHGNVSGGGGVNVGATVATELNVRLLSTGSGGTLWRSSASAEQNVGHVSVNPGRLPSISGSDPNAAYANMVQQMVVYVTNDFRPTWRKQ